MRQQAALEGFRRGSKVAFAELAEHTVRHLRTLAEHKLGSPDDANDVLALSLFVAWEPEIWVRRLVADMLDDAYMKARDVELATLREALKALEQQREWDRVAQADMARNEQHMKAKLQKAEKEVAELKAMLAEMGRTV